MATLSLCISFSLLMESLLSTFKGTHSGLPVPIAWQALPAELRLLRTRYGAHLTTPSSSLHEWWMEAAGLLCVSGEEAWVEMGQRHSSVCTQTPSFASVGCHGAKWCPEVSALVGRGGDACGTPGCGDPGGWQCLRRAENSRGCQGVHIQVMQGSGLAIWAWAGLHWASVPTSPESWTCPSSLPSFSLPTFSYIGDCEISVELQKLQAGVNGIQVGGAWRDCLQVVGQGRGSGLMLEEAAAGVLTPSTEASTNQGTPGPRS